ncbi:TonB-dependent receptor [Sphingomonas sp. R86521]|uniref:TonB-dependent receptor n=1 Tax=Sphingomonas sp. R86521 TaxID=3093860 RepID=UPI0036D29BE6
MLRRSAIFFLLSSTTLASATTAAKPVPAVSRSVAFDIPASDLATALNELGRQAGVQISFPFDSATGHSVAQLKGRMAPLDAARQLMSGTTLTVAEATPDHILLIAGSQAISQAGLSDASFPESKDIVVTGFRLATRRAIETKRRSAQIIDSVSQDDVSQLPDVNVVEAARRIPGLSVISDRDSSRGHDNYQYVTIRGLDSRYNLVTVDGAQIASADSSYRGAQLALLPSSLVGEIQAIKTVTAQYDPHALGGQLNLVTKSAFDTGSMLTAQALGGWTSQSGKVVPDKHANIRADATAAMLFGADKQFGLVLSGEYQQLHASALATLPGDTAGAGWTYYTAAGAQTGDIPNSTGRAVPVRVQDYAFDEKRERYSINGKFEYRPSDRFGLSIFGGYYHELSDEDRYEALALPSTSYTPGATADTGKLNTGNYQLGLVAQPEKRRTWLINGNAHYDFSEKLKLTGGISDSKAHYNEDRWMYKWNTGMVITPTSAATTNLALYGYSYQNANGGTTIALNDPAAAANAANYGPRYWRNIVYDIDNTVRGLHGELAWNFDADDRGFGLQGGVTQTLTHVESLLNYREWFAKDAASAALIGNLDKYSQSTVPTPISAPGINFDLIDADKAQAVLVNHPEWFRQNTGRVSDSNSAFYQLRESITAGYGQARWQSDDFNLQAGLRYDSTSVGVTTRVNGTNTTLSREHGYAYALPSGVATWNVTSAFKLRVGISETIGRPDYGQYGATTTQSLDMSNVARPLTINQGNPDLKPRRSWNYDLSGELYLGRGGLVSAAVFYKDIHDEIFNLTTQESGVYYADGATYNATISQPVNAAKAMVKGAELQIVKDRLDFLPGPLANFGVSLNATWLDGRFDFVGTTGASRRIGALFNQPDHIYNATLFYAVGPATIRAAFNRIGAAPVSVDSQYAWRDIWQDSRDQLDLQASYNIKPWLQVMSQVQNVTNTSFQAHLGQNRELLQTRYPVGRTVWFGFILKPRFRK